MPRLLAPLGLLVGEFTARRMARRGARVDVPVICVGNFVAGGAGKTPTVMALAQLLAQWGERPYLLTRGYGSQPSGAPLLVDPRRHSIDAVGDEALLLARIAPTIVSAERVTAAKMAVAAGATVVVLDDGLQSRRLEPDCAIAVVDGAVGIGNGSCLPAGPLRAPLAAQLRHVHAILIIGRGDGGRAVAAAAQARSLPVFDAEFMPNAEAIARLSGRPLLAFAGIGRPEKFFETLAEAGLDVAEKRAFPDHHRYSSADVETLLRRAAAHGLSLVTTEKDAVRLPTGTPVEVVPVALTIGQRDAFAANLAQRIAKARSTASASRQGG